MDMIEAKFQEMRTEARNELINSIAVHEAGHFVMMLLLMRQAPYYITLTPETGNGMTLPFRLPDSIAEYALIMMAGYAAEKLWDSSGEDTGLGDYLHHDDCDNQDFLNMCRELGGTVGVTADYYIFELKSFQAAEEVLKNHKSLIFSLATELKYAEGTEMDYDAIKNFCRDNRRAFPLLGSVTFSKPTPKEKKELQLAIDEYKADQKAAIN